MAAEAVVVWSPEAEQDLLDIWRAVAAGAAAGIADDQLRRIAAACAKLATWPTLGRTRSELLISLRSLTISPYIAFYRIRASRIEIVRVLHDHRDIEVIFSS
jgi:toxin ParE1/3/4